MSIILHIYRNLIHSVSIHKIIVHKCVLEFNSIYFYSLSLPVFNLIAHKNHSSIFSNLINFRSKVGRSFSNFPHQKTAAKTFPSYRYFAPSTVWSGSLSFLGAEGAAT